MKNGIDPARCYQIPVAEEGDVDLFGDGKELRTGECSSLLVVWRGDSVVCVWLV